MLKNENNSTKRKKFSLKNENSKRKRLENKHEPTKKPENKKPQYENKGDFKCKNCGGNLVRRWIFSENKDVSPYTLLQCEDCGSSTKPREIRYQNNGYVWGTKFKKEVHNGSGEYGKLRSESTTR